jgi:SAM-dependent methyltransferase
MLTAMKAAHLWEPTKFVRHGDGWRASRDRHHVAPSSRLAADLTAGAYDTAVRAFARGDLLDLGCGSVPLYGMYRDLVSSTTCADWAGTPHPSPHVDHEVDLNQSLPFADASFDTIVLTDVLEHLPYPDRLFGEMSRLLRAGGHLIVGVPFYYWIHEEPHDHHRYTEYRLRLFCEDHGLELVECRQLGGSRDVLLDVAAKYLLMKPKPLKWAAVLPGLLGKRGGSAGGGGLMPLGYVLVATRS